MPPGKRPGIERKGQTLTEVAPLEWVEVQHLEIGESFTLGEQCPLTFTVREKFITTNGRVQVDTTVLSGLSDGRAYSKTMYRPTLEVLIVPDEFVGERLGRAIEAFRNHNRRGRDRVELGSDIWPYTATVEGSEGAA